MRKAADRLRIRAGSLQRTQRSTYLTCRNRRGRGSLILHSAEISEGSLSVGDIVSMQVSPAIREAITRNHTSAHLLHAALRKVLGTHVHQAGQLVNAKEMRFDFSHFEAMTREEIAEVEHEVNRVILSGIEVKRYETDIASAKEKGAMALFGEKYGERVRVCEVGDFSIELVRRYAYQQYGEDRTF